MTYQESFEQVPKAENKLKSFLRADPKLQEAIATAVMQAMTLKGYVSVDHVPKEAERRHKELVKVLSKLLDTVTKKLNSASPDLWLTGEPQTLEGSAAFAFLRKPFAQPSVVNDAFSRFIRLSVQERRKYFVEAAIEQKYLPPVLSQLNTYIERISATEPEEPGFDKLLDHAANALESFR